MERRPSRWWYALLFMPLVGLLMARSQDSAPTYPLELFGTKINAYTGVFGSRRT